MPIYEFKCKNEHITEELHLIISEAPVKIKCPQCGKRAKRILSGGVGFVFNQPGGTYSGSKRQEEIHKAMDDFRTGKGNKKDV